MLKEDIKALYRDFETAQSAYDEYFKQFLTSFRDGIETRKATKVFTTDEMKKIKSLHAKKDAAWKKYKVAFDEWNPTR